MVLNRLQKDAKPYALYSFLWALLLAALIVTPIMIVDQGYFLHYGDFNVQEIPFYRLAHDAVLSGEIGWSHLTDLGANFIGSYSFYLLGSPFFWLTILLPSSWVPYAIGPILVLKLAFTSLSAYIFIRRYVRQQKFAVVGGILYAFSSFSVYNIFFFHFHEPMIILPLLLAALDEFHETKRKGVVALAVFAAATVNYYFFIGQVVFAIIYYIVKLICKSYRFHIKEFLLLAVECVIGFGMSLFLLLPSIAAITGNYRITQLINGWNAILYPHSQRYAQIFVSMFFPGDVPAKNNFTANAGGKWASVAAYLPMFSMTFVIAQIRDRKRSFFRRILIILFIMALVPGLNSVFQLLNDNYYARWFYILTLFMALVTVQSLDQLKEIRFWRGFIPTAVITVLTALLIGLMPYKEKKGETNYTIRIGLESSVMHFWFFVLVAVGGLALTWLIYVIYKKKPKFFFAATAIFLSLFVILYAEMYLWAGRVYTDRSDEFLIHYALNGGKDVTLDDIKEVRSDFYNTSDNIGMFWQVPNIQAFHSIVPGSVMEFYNNVGVKRDVGSRPSVEYYGLRALLSVKYLFAEQNPEKPPKETFDLMPGYRYLRSENGYDIYENESYVPMGFTYDSFITTEEYMDLSTDVRHLALLKAMVLSQDTMQEYSDITDYTDGKYLNLNFSHDDNKSQNARHPEYIGFDSMTKDFEYDKESYFSDAKKLKENSCSSFAYTKNGFEAAFTNTGDDNLLFFSVPYDDGWTAYVNGEEVSIAKVNIGFMAVRVPGHQKSEIVFKYRTPMLKEGCIAAGISAAALVVYVIILAGFRAKQKPRRTYRIKKTKKS